VEGQFYLLWSLLAWSTRSAGAMAFAMTVLSFASVALQAAAKQRTVLLFFTMPSRMYEFSAGALAIFLYDHVSPTASSVWHFIGAASIIGSFFLVRAEHGPISLYSLPVVTGTMLLVASPRGFLGKHLSRPATRYIGTISYSVYLIHWPAIVMCTFKDFKHPMLWAFVITTFLAPLMYHFVEKVFRSRREPLKAQVGILFCWILFSVILAYALVSKRSADVVIHSNVLTGKEDHTAASKTLSMPDYIFELDEFHREMREAGTIVDVKLANTSYTLVLGGTLTTIPYVKWHTRT
jgi:peptidoglycan/LPS O-acetylase OafA/YrhL